MTLKLHEYDSNLLGTQKHITYNKCLIKTDYHQHILQEVTVKQTTKKQKIMKTKILSKIISPIFMYRHNSVLAGSDLKAVA